MRHTCDRTASLKEMLTCICYSLSASEAVCDEWCAASAETSKPDRKWRAPTGSQWTKAMPSRESVELLKSRTHLTPKAKMSRLSEPSHPCCYNCDCEKIKFTEFLYTRNNQCILSLFFHQLFILTLIVLFWLWWFNACYLQWQDHFSLDIKRFVVIV